MKFIKNNKVIAVVLIALAVVAGFALLGNLTQPAQAQDLDILESEYSDVWTREYRNVEVGLPENANVPNVFFKFYDLDFSRIGGASNSYDTGIDFMSNAIITDVIIDVRTPFLPGTNTVAIQINTANDLLSASTNLQFAGVTNGIPQANDIATAVRVNAAATNNLRILFDGGPVVTAFTSGAARVYLKGFQGKTE